MLLFKYYKSHLVSQWIMCFTCSQYHGVINADSTLNVKLAFNPENINTTYVENFEILAVGLTSKATIKCIGTGKGSDVNIEVKSINFGLTSPDMEVTRSFKIRNNSNIPAVFQVKSLFIFIYLLSYFVLWL